ncbi:hypothetical protein ACFO0N_10805 [Halobium salinum]|uniref:Uncharacterized protein n=1 Tax=Halobium salinum TaxID=1364940 RepID=A0ABD5PCJ8_9EURY|nr:hypothetical protein [Halobium salinum]
MTTHAGQSPELWAFVASNLLTFLVGAGLSAVAYRAYRRERARALLLAAGGFACLTLGTVVEATYELLLNPGSHAVGRELFLLRTVEGVTIAVGLALLVLSVRWM